jgi:hypothetical protein
MDIPEDSNEGMGAKTRTIMAASCSLSPITGAHHWLIEGDIGTCKYCGEIHDYSPKVENMRFVDRPTSELCQPKHSAKYGRSLVGQFLQNGVLNGYN